MRWGGGAPACVGTEFAALHFQSASAKERDNMVASEFIARNYHLKSNSFEPFYFIAALAIKDEN